MSSSKKRPQKSSSSSSKKQRAGADEEARLVDALSEKKPTRKEIESTEPGGAPTVIERTLPSFFDFYPRAKRAYDALKKKGAPKYARVKRMPDTVMVSNVSLECREISLCISSRSVIAFFFSITFPILGTGTAQWIEP